jgi:hypothetical protein
MDDPYGPPWSTHEYSEQRLVTDTCAKAFSLTPGILHDTLYASLVRTPGLLEDTSGKYSSPLQH